MNYKRSQSGSNLSTISTGRLAGQLSQGCKKVVLFALITKTVMLLRFPITMTEHSMGVLQNLPRLLTLYLTQISWGSARKSQRSRNVSQVIFNKPSKFCHIICIPSDFDVLYTGLHYKTNEAILRTFRSLYRFYWAENISVLFFKQICSLVERQTIVHQCHWPTEVCDIWRKTNGRKTVQPMHPSFYKLLPFSWFSYCKLTVGFESVLYCSEDLNHSPGFPPEKERQ